MFPLRRVKGHLLTPSYTHSTTTAEIVTGRFDGTSQAYIESHFDTQNEWGLDEVAAPSTTIQRQKAGKASASASELPAKKTSTTSKSTNQQQAPHESEAGPALVPSPERRREVERAPSAQQSRQSTPRQSISAVQEAAQDRIREQAPAYEQDDLPALEDMPDFAAATGEQDEALPHEAIPTAASGPPPASEAAVVPTAALSQTVASSSAQQAITASSDKPLEVTGPSRAGKRPRQQSNDDFEDPSDPEEAAQLEAREQQARESNKKLRAGKEDFPAPRPTAPSREPSSATPKATPVSSGRAEALASVPSRPSTQQPAKKLARPGSSAQPAGRVFWTEEETTTLKENLYEIAKYKLVNRSFQPYVYIEKLRGPKGDGTLGNRNNKQFKDRAVNILKDLRKSGEMMPYWERLLFPTYQVSRRDRTSLPCESEKLTRVRHAPRETSRTSRERRRLRPPMRCPRITCVRSLPSSRKRTQQQRLRRKRQARRQTTATQQTRILQSTNDARSYATSLLGGHEMVYVVRLVVMMNAIGLEPCSMLLMSLGARCLAMPSVHRQAVGRPRRWPGSPSR